MAVELAQAYVSLVVDTAKIPNQIKQAFGSSATSGITRSAGQRMGSEVSSGLGETLRSGVEHAVGEIPMGNILSGALSKGLKGGAIAAAATAGGLLATTLGKGFERLTAIDTAQGKLRALGNNAQQVTTIMNSALAAVKGTAFGLGDAATIAASAVAAGIKPGEDLTKYLKLTADAASVAGSSLGDMGHIINKVQTSGKAYTDDLNELSDRGLPIFKWLQDEYKVSADQFRKMVEGGKVDAATFQKVIEKNIGGAALKMGDTFTGSVKNVEASLGRLGAAILGPTFKRLQGGANDSTGAIDKLTPKVTELAKALDDKVFGDWGPKLKTAFQQLQANPEVQKALGEIKDNLGHIVDTAKETAPAISKIVGSLAAGAGQAGFLGFSLAIKVAKTALDALAPPLQAIGDFMSKHQAVVTAAVAAWMTFKTVGTLQSYIEPLGASVRKLGEEATQAGGKAAYLKQSIMNVGGKVAFTGAIAAFGLLAQQTDKAGQSTENARKAQVGLTTAMGAAAGAAAGPWGAVLGGAAGFGLGLYEWLHKNKDAADDLKKSFEGVANQIDQVTGKVTQQALSDAYTNFNDKGYLKTADALNIDRGQVVRAAAGVDPENRTAIDDYLASIVGADKQFQEAAKDAASKGGKFSAQDLANAALGRRPDILKSWQQIEGKTQLPGRAELGDAAGGAFDLQQAIDGQAAQFEQKQSIVTGRNQALSQAVAVEGDLANAIKSVGAAVDSVPNDKTVVVKSPPGQDPREVADRFTKLGYTVQEINPDKSITLTLNDQQAVNSLEDWNKLTPAQKQAAIDANLAPAKSTYDAWQPAPKQVSLVATMLDQASIKAGKGSIFKQDPQQPQQRAKGGAIFGAGGPTSDSIPALLSRDEHVWTAAETDAVGGHGAMYRLRSMALAGGLKFATGGTPFGINEAIKAAQDMEGHPYLWGGSGPERFDCSGFVGFLQQVAMGLGRLTKRIYTTDTILQGATAGLKPGFGPAGTLFKVGVSKAHMAATIGGLNAESGGANGTSGIGAGRAGALDGQFPFKFYLPNELIAGYNSQMSGGTLVTWTADDENELENDKIAVQEAQQRRDEVYANKDGKYTDIDKRKADQAIKDAQQKVVDKQGQKDKQGTLENGTRIAPQAPALQKHYSDEEQRHAKLLAAVEDANEKRNTVYDEPSVYNDTDRQNADIELQTAIENLQNDDDGSSNKPKSLKEAFTSAASNIVGVLFDAAKAQLPSVIGSSHWWNVADEAMKLNADGKKNQPSSLADALGAIPSFGMAQFLGQLGYNPNAGVPDWVQKLEAPGQGQKPKVKVYDTGGWLMPGEMGINLSSKPEPIFNSPQQLQQFANVSKPAPQSGLTHGDVQRMLQAQPAYHIHVADEAEAVRRIQQQQKRDTLSFTR